MDKLFNEVFNTLDTIRWTIISLQEVELQKMGGRGTSNDALRILDDLWDKFIELNELLPEEEEVVTLDLYLDEYEYEDLDEDDEEELD